MARGGRWGRRGEAGSKVAPPGEQSPPVSGTSCPVAPQSCASASVHSSTAARLCRDRGLATCHPAAAHTWHHLGHWHSPSVCMPSSCCPSAWTDRQTVPESLAPPAHCPLVGNMVRRDTGYSAALAVPGISPPCSHHLHLPLPCLKSLHCAQSHPVAFTSVLPQHHQQLVAVGASVRARGVPGPGSGLPGSFGCMFGCYSPFATMVLQVPSHPYARRGR